MAGYRKVTILAHVPGDAIESQAIVDAMRAASLGAGLDNPVAVSVAPWHPRGCDCARCPFCPECGGELNAGHHDACDCPRRGGC